MIIGICIVQRFENISALLKKGTVCNNMIQVFTGFVNESKYKFEFTDYLCVLKEVAHVASLSGNSCWADSHGEAFKKISALLKYEETREIVSSIIIFLTDGRAHIAMMKDVSPSGSPFTICLRSYGTRVRAKVEIDEEIKQSDDILELKNKIKAVMAGLHFDDFALNQIATYIYNVM